MSEMRITLAFAGAEPDLEAMASLARFAAALQAELSGLFVEDQNLLRLAALPIAREFSHAGAARTLEPNEMERQLQRQATLVRAALVKTAEQAGARWSFATARGSFAGEIGSVISQSEAVAVGLTAQARRFLGAAPLARNHRRRTIPRPIAVVLTRAPASIRALRLAIRLSDTLHRPLTVLIAATSDAMAETLQREAQDEVAGSPARFIAVLHAAPGAVALAARQVEAALVLMEASRETLDPETLRLLNEQLACPALLVR